MTSPRDILATVSAAQEHTRRVKRAGWIPLAIFGLLVLPALLFHLQSRTVRTVLPDGTTRPVTRAYDNVDGGQGLFWYWQLVIPLGYVLVAVFYGLRNRRAGVRTAVRAYLITGVLLVIGIYCLANSAGPLHLSNFGLHGLEATVTIGLALFVLAGLERSVALGVSALVVTGVAVAAAQYDIENLWYEVFGLQVPAWLDAATNDLALSLTLLLCAAVVGLVDGAGTRSAAV